MGSVRARKESGLLLFDFRFRGKRCREQTLLPDTPVNRRQMEETLKRIEAEILIGHFDYGEWFPQSRNAKQFAAEQSHVPATDSVPTFSEFFELWFEEKRPEWRISYRETVRFHYEKRLKTSFGDLPLDQIDRERLLGFRSTLAAERKKGGAPLSAPTINRYMAIMRMVMNEASTRFSIPNPADNIKPLKQRKVDIHPFSMEEVRLILSSVRPDFQNYLTVRFFTGMRTAEVDGLQWKFVDFDRGQILIRETWVHDRLEYTKTDGSQREIDMSEPVRAALLDQRERTGSSETGFVFQGRNSQPINYTNFTNRVWKPLLRHLGLPYRRPYQMRHTAATLWLASGENPLWIARQMGHVNTEMLFRVYSRYVPDLTRRDGSAFDQLLQVQLSK